MSTAITLPRKNMLIGITHLADGTKLIKEPKVLKVGVGLPRGKAVDVYVDPDGLWNIRQGKSVSGKLKFETVARVKTRAEAETAWRKAFDEADLCGYPRKISYFNFSRPVIGKDGAEIYIPDFAATEAYSFADPQHPGAPTELDIVFLADDCYQMAYAMWSSSELRCTGDGENAVRSVQMYDEEKKVPEPLREAWRTAKAAGERTFPVVNGCWVCNCPYSKERDGKPSPCKPSGDLRFQLSRNIRVGGTAFFHTSGYRSIIQIFSAVERIKELTGGRIAGIPLKLVLRSYKTSHNGQVSLQSGVSIEFRASDMESVRVQLIEQAFKFRAAAGLVPPTVKLLDAPEETASLDDDPPMSAQAMANEFYVDTDDQDEQPTQSIGPGSESAAQASNEKVKDFGERLKKAAEKAAPPAEAKAEKAPPPATIEVKPVEAKADPPAEVKAEAKPDPPPAAEPPIGGKGTPWETRQDMNKDLLSAKEALGPAEFDAIATGISWGKASHTDPKIYAVYERLKARVKEMDKRPAPADQPLF